MSFLIGDKVVINEKVLIDLPQCVGQIATIVERAEGSNNYDWYVKMPNKENARVLLKESEINKLTNKEVECYMSIKKGDTVLYPPTGETATVSQIDYLHGQISLSFEDQSNKVVGIESVRKLDKESGIMAENKKLKFSVGDFVKAVTDDRWNNREGYVVVIDSVNDGYGVKFDNGESTVFDEHEIEFVEVKVIQKGYFEEKALKLGKLVDEKQAAYGDSVTKTSKLIKTFLEDYKTDEGYLISEELLDHILLQVRIIDKQNRIFSNPKADKMGESPYDDISGYGLLGGRMQETK